MTVLLIFKYSFETFNSRSIKTMATNREIKVELGIEQMGSNLEMAVVISIHRWQCLALQNRIRKSN